MKEKKEEEPKIALNIVLLPDKITFNKAVLYSSRLASKGLDTEFVLDGKSFRPHITLYQGYYPERNTSILLQAIKELSKTEKLVEIEMDDFQISHGTFVFWNAKKTPELVALHEAVVQIANPLREGNIAPNTIEMLDELPTHEKQMVESTGSILNHELFHPHITLTRLKDAKRSNEAIEYLRGIESSKFLARELTVAKLGVHGTISNNVGEAYLRYK